MTKRDLATKVAKKTGINFDIVKLVIEEAAEEIMCCLEQDDVYYQRGFGSFEVQKRKAKSAYHFGKSEVMRLQERRVIVFHPSDIFTEKVEQQKQ